MRVLSWLQCPDLLTGERCEQPSHLQTTGALACLFGCFLNECRDPTQPFSSLVEAGNKQCNLKSLEALKFRAFFPSTLQALEASLLATFWP